MKHVGMASIGFSLSYAFMEFITGSSVSSVDAVFIAASALMGSILLYWAWVISFKVIHLNTASMYSKDDPSYPFRLEASLTLPEFMEFWFLSQAQTNEHLIVKMRTKYGAKRYINKTQLRSHPRLVEYTVTGPDGKAIPELCYHRKVVEG